MRSAFDAVWGRTDSGVGVRVRLFDTSLSVDYRYDQLMKLGWQFLLEISLANLIVTAILVLVLGGKG